MEPTERQLQACRINNISIPDEIRWHGSVMVIPHDEEHNLVALVSEHGSITYCPETMLDAHLAGVKE